MNEKFETKSYVDQAGAKVLADEINSINTRLLNGYYSIDFIEGSVNFQEYNCGRDFVITEIITANVVGDPILYINEKPIETIEGVEVSAGDLISWEIQREQEDLPASIGIYITAKQS